MAASVSQRPASKSILPSGKYGVFTAVISRA